MLRENSIVLSEEGGNFAKGMYKLFSLGKIGWGGMVPSR
jgi:hypothetical protein